MGPRYETCFMSPFVVPVILRWLKGFGKFCEALCSRLISFCVYSLMTRLASAYKENKICGGFRALRGVTVTEFTSFSQCGLLGYDTV